MPAGGTSAEQVGSWSSPRVRRRPRGGGGKRKTLDRSETLGDAECLGADGMRSMGTSTTMRSRRADITSTRLDRNTLRRCCGGAMDG